MFQFKAVQLTYHIHGGYQYQAKEEGPYLDRIILEQIGHQFCKGEDAHHYSYCHCQQEVAVDRFPELAYLEAEQQTQALAGDGLDGFYQFRIDTGQESNRTAAYTRNDVGCTHQEPLDGNHQI